MLPKKVIRRDKGRNRLVLVQRSDSHAVEFGSHENALQVILCRKADGIIKRWVGRDAALEIRVAVAFDALDFTDEFDFDDAQLPLLVRIVRQGNIEASNNTEHDGPTCRD